MNDLGLREGSGMPFRYHDGGRSVAGYRGDTGDCAVRAIAIATGTPYKTVYDELHARIKANPTLVGKRRSRGASPRNGVPMTILKAYLAERGWMWVALSGIGTGCTAHLAVGELPSGRLIARVSKHVVAIINGELRDTHNPSRGGTRCVYGYWKETS